MHESTPEYDLSKEQAKLLVERTVAIIGDKWSLLLIGELGFGKSSGRFNEMLRELSPISSRTLSVKLSKLCENGIIQKTIENASPPYTRYALTEKGIDLVFAFRAMADWSLKWQNQASNGTEQ
jgi:DNA-binding HxlR family transcriptional regulator